MVPAIDTMGGHGLSDPTHMHIHMHACTPHTHFHFIYALYMAPRYRKLWLIFGRVVHDKNYVCFALDAYITSP